MSAFRLIEVSCVSGRVVPTEGLEPPHLAAHGPEPCASTNSATWALNCLLLTAECSATEARILRDAGQAVKGDLVLLRKNRRDPAGGNEKSRRLVKVCGFSLLLIR